MPANSLQGGIRQRRLNAIMIARKLYPALPLLLALASGCATVHPPQRQHLSDQDGQVQSCARWFQALDAAVERTRVRDAAASPVLRTVAW